MATTRREKKEIEKLTVKLKLSQNSSGKQREEQFGALGANRKVQSFKKRQQINTNLDTHTQKLRAKMLFG